MTRKEREAIKRRCEAATPGPWIDFNNPIDEAWADECPEDAEFIAHARSDVPMLVEEVEQLVKYLAIAFRNWDDETRAENPEHCIGCRDKAKYHDAIGNKLRDYGIADADEVE